MTAALIRAAQSALVTSAGLVATVRAFTLRDQSDSAVAFAGGNVTLPANATRYLFADLFTRDIRVLRHKVHRGGILLAEVTTGAGSVSEKREFTPRLPASRIGRTLQKLQAGFATVRVALMGDSLTGGATAVPFWKTLVFSAGSPYSLSKAGTAGLALYDHAIGGETSHLGAAQIAQAIACSTNALNATQITYGPRYGYQNFALGAHSFAESSIYKADLVVIGFGANGGTENYQQMELIVRRLRKRGIDVLIQTENHRAADLTAGEADIPVLAAIADAYGAELADTWSYFREKADAGTVVFDDGIHPSTVGHEEYAKAIRSVLHAWDVTAENVFNPGRVLGAATSQQYQDAAPNATYAIFDPMATTGVAGPVVAFTSATSPRNIAADFGGKADALSCTVLTTGQQADYGCSMMGAVDLYIDGSDAATLEVRTNGGATLVKTLTLTDTNRIQVVEALNLVEASALTEFRNSLGLRLVCTAGTARIIAVITQTREFEEIDVTNAIKRGTWVKEVGYYGHQSYWYSDTVGDSIDLAFQGTECQVLLSRRTAAGIVDVYVDGRLHQTGLDLYIAGTYVYALNINGLGYGSHRVQIALTGANGAAGASAAGNRRLGVIAAYAIDGR